MKKRHWVILVAVAFLAGGLLWVFLIHEPVEEGRCRLARKKVDINSQLMGLAFYFIEPLNGKPESVQDLPTGFDRPAYYEIKSADKLIPMALDFSSTNLRLCVDTDGDGVLSEEQCLTPKTVKATRASSEAQQFGPISLVSRDGDSRSGGEFYVKSYRTDAPAAVVVFPSFFHTGRLRLAGRTYRVAIVDGDCDGRFRSILSLPLDRQWRVPSCDIFAIDLNGDGTFNISLFERSEVVPLGRLIRLKDDYYAIDIAPDGMSLALSRTEPQFGTLAVEPNNIDADLRLWSDAADQHLSQGRTWQLPAGKYKAIHAAFTTVDASGNVWTCSSDTSSAFTSLGSLEFFTIEQGETTSIRMGPPFVLTANVQQTGSRLVSISPVLVGSAGEEYSTALQQGRQRPSPPAFKIVDEKGTVLVTDKFEYG
jgi:hypothetical protein